MDWQEVIKKAEHYRALDQDTVYLHDGADRDKPWHLVTRIITGSGAHRLGICSDITLVAWHNSGITFRWIFRLEDDDANGVGHYRISVARIAQLMEFLPRRHHNELKNELLDVAAKVEERATENMEQARRQFGDAAILRLLAAEGAA